MLGHILLANAQNKLRSSTDVQRHSSKPWQLDSEVLSVVPEERLRGTSLMAWGESVSTTAAVKQMLNAIFNFHLFPAKVKILFWLVNVGINITLL